MIRWLRVIVRSICGMPIVLVTLLLMGCVWAGAAEIYSAVIWARGSSGFAGIVLGGLNALFTWVLVFTLAGHSHDLREMRLPQQRQVLACALIIIIGPVVVLPCAFVWAMHGGARDVLLVAVGSAAGTAGALLWRLRPRFGNTPQARGDVATMRGIRPEPPNPWLAARVALGPPYAPASWQRRVIQLTALCAAVAAAPLLVLAFAESLRPLIFTILLRLAQLVSFLTAIGLCWVWPLSRLVAVLNPQYAAVPEFGLLPGLGSGRQQLRRLSLVALSLPAAGLIVLLIMVLSQAALDLVPHHVYARLVLEILLIPMITLPIVLGQIVKSRTSPAWAGAILLFSQMWTLTFLVWSTWQVPDTTTIRTWTLGLFLVCLVSVAAISVQSLRRLLQRPHPFVEVSS